MTSSVRLPFGKYRGQLLQDVPRQYLFWCWDNMKNMPSTLRAAIEEQLGFSSPKSGKRNEKSFAGTPYTSRLQAELQKWYRESMLKWHPDKKGGDPRVASALNSLKDRLDGVLRTL